MIDTARLWRVALLVVIFSLISTIFVAIISQDRAHAAQTVPYKVNFQGRLTDATGAAKADGQYNIRFRIFSAASGGSALWTETRETTDRVTLTNGLFSVQLGDVTALTPALFTSQPLYLEVELPTPATATCSTASCQTWTEGAMTPRSKFGSAPYAMNSDTLDGLDATDFAQLGSSNAFTGATFSIAGAANAAKFNVSNLFNVDSSSSIISIGASDTTGTLLVLDTKTSAGDPTGSNGAMYYNSNSGKFRCYQAGAWTDCISAGGGGGSGTLQDAYDNSSSPATISTSAAKGVKIVAGAAPTSDMFTIDNTGQPVSTAGVSAAQITYVGGTGAIEGSGIRVDYTPGGDSGSTWNGMRVVANPTGAASGVTSYGIKLEGPTTPGAGSEVGLRVASGFDIGVDIASGGLQLAVGNDPSTPAANALKVFAVNRAGRTMLGIKDSSGSSYEAQPFLGTNKVSMLAPSGSNTTTLASVGLNGSSTGTATARTITTASLYASMRRLGYVSAATAGSLTGLRQNYNFMHRGASSAIGGFYFSGRFGLAATTSDSRMFIGINANTGAPTNVEASTQTNAIGFGCDAADTSLTFMHNDGSGAATKDTLTGTFPCKTNSTDVYEMRIYSPPGGSAIYYSISRLNSTDYYEGVASTDIPASTTLLTYHFWITNNATAAAVAIDLSGLYIETEY